MRSVRRAFIAGLWAAMLVTTPSVQARIAARSGEPPAAVAAGPRDFDFLVGRWNVHHRRMKTGTREWIEFEGTCVNRPLLEGAGNVEEHALDSPAGAYRAVGLRAFDAKSKTWAIWWLDGRYPHGTFDPPVKGAFQDGIGTFVSDYEQDGKPMRVRFLWSRITPTSARWEQATSSDAGRTWDTNWIMEFTRAKEPPAAPPAADGAGVHDFDFLRGDWRVRHRYLRGATREWAEAEGTCRNGALAGGWANLEEHWMGVPGAAYRALGLRAFDRQTGLWAIWWLDGRDPHGALDPPLRGRFANGTGTFFGDTRVNGTPARIRFLWSRITPTSAQWEQALSSDEGKTWETVWTMAFERVSSPEVATEGPVQASGSRP